MADDPEDRKFYCDTIADEADHMNKLVMQLLSLSRLELGAEQTFDEDIDLHALCAEAVRKTAVLCENRGLTVEYENAHITVRTDGDLLDQVLMNYLSNAIRYTPEGKHIEISATKTGNSVRLSVFNEGDGLPEEELPKIWEKFYRTDRARTREAGGTGIGLSLVRAIADTLHGACGAENVEGGICFWFELPDLLTGGEIPAMAVADAVCRMVPGVLPDEEAFTAESHWDGLLEHPQYTRPENWRGREVPEVLLSGHHANIEAWRREMSLRRTKKDRPDLFAQLQPQDKRDKKILDKIHSDER